MGPILSPMRRPRHRLGEGFMIEAVNMLAKFHELANGKHLGP